MQIAHMYRPKTLPLITGISLSTIRRLIKKNQFPPPIQLSTQAVGWHGKDIQIWLDGRVAVSAAHTTA